MLTTRSSTLRCRNLDGHRSWLSSVRRSVAPNPAFSRSAADARAISLYEALNRLPPVTKIALDVAPSVVGQQLPALLPAGVAFDAMQAPPGAELARCARDAEVLVATLAFRPALLLRSPSWHQSQAGLDTRCGTPSRGRVSAVSPEAPRAQEPDPSMRGASGSCRRDSLE
jgi:hypothetical protein